ncbi:MAG TPA: ABC transporter ATP-binding protein [Roseiarcus sp.]|jgi:ABC-type Fe3+/spermidine/putrescine transport system ATPase subunit
MSELVLRALAKSYRDVPVVSGVDLSVASGEFIALLGPSGCGKTTVLRMIAGLIEPSGGQVLIDGRDVTPLPAHKRKLGLVFQSYALFPHLSVFDNVAFGLRRQGVRGEALRQRVDEALALVRLAPLADRLPRQLSGGQQQRVALARSIAPRPSILLLDEPLSNLDAALRDEMQFEIKRLQRALKITSVFVTHDQAEALSMSDRVCVLDQGVVQQVGAPDEIYRKPANAFVAGFIGRSNRLRGRVDGRASDGTLVRLDGGATLLSAERRELGGADVDVIIRRQAVRVVAGDRGAGLAGTIVMRSFSGERIERVVRLEGGAELIAECDVGAHQDDPPVGAAVRVSIDPQWVFLAASEA